MTTATAIQANAASEKRNFKWETRNTINKKELNPALLNDDMLK